MLGVLGARAGYGRAQWLMLQQATPETTSLPVACRIGARLFVGALAPTRHGD